MQFGPIVIAGLGFDKFMTLKITMVAAGFQILFILISSIGSTLFRNTQTMWFMFNFAVSIVGVIMVREIHHGKWARFFGFMLSFTYVANVPILYAMMSSNMAGFTKRMTVSSMVRDFPTLNILCSYCAILLIWATNRSLSLSARATSLARNYSLPTKRRRTLLAFLPF